MKAHPWNRLAPLLCTGVFLLNTNSLTKAQQPSQPKQPSGSPAAAQTPAAAPSDPAAQIDQLIKKANEQMNSQGHMKEAEETAKQALELSQKLSDKPRILQSMISLGSAYYYVGRMQESLEICEQVVTLARKAGNPRTLSRAFNNVASVLRDLGRYEDSLNYFNQVIPLARELKDLPMLWTANRNIGVLYIQMGDLDKAEAPLKESLRISHELKDEPGKSLVKNVSKVTQEASLLTLGLWEASREHYAAALNYYEQSLASKPENPAFTAELLTNMAAAHEKLGESQKSVELLQQALKIQESTGTGINGTTLSDLGYSQESLGQLKEALATAERGQARAFLDMLALSRTGLADELTPEQRRREDEILARISAVQKDLWKENIPVDEEKKHKAELTSAEDDLEAFHLEVRHANPHYASIRYPEPITIGQIQKDLLDAQTVLVEFLLGEKRSLVWAVSKDKVSVGVLPRRKEIEEEVSAFRKALTEKTSSLTLRESLSEIGRRGQKLYASLLGPVESAITADRTLIIIPDGVLGYLPFETLVAGFSRGVPSDGRNAYLLEKFAIVYGPSASALAAIKGMHEEPGQRPKMFLAFGDPIVDVSTPPSKTEAEGNTTRAASPEPAATASEEYAERGFSLTRLPYTRAEVLGISKLYPASQRQVYLGEQEIG